MDIRKVKNEEFSTHLEGSKESKAFHSENTHSFFLFGEKSGVRRDDTLGTVEFFNLSQEELSDAEELELLINICGRPGEFTEKVNGPRLKTITDYEEEARHINRSTLLIWIAQITFFLIPITLTIWMITFLLH